MVQALVETARKLVFVAALGCVFVLRSLAQQDPPSRVARLNYTSGSVSMEPAGVDDWAPAEINHPFTTGDYLYTDTGASAELHLDVAAIRMGQGTSFGFLNLNDQTVQIKLAEGDMYFRIHHFGPDQVFEVDTPNAAVQLLRDGVYRFRVDPNGAMSFLVVREGQAEVTGGGQAITVDPGNSVTVSGAEQQTFDVENAPAPDEFDNWCAERDAREARAPSRRYLPPTVIGYEDLDQYGTWQQESEYGPVWYPSTVAVGWAPYHYGHWAWIQPWGWTWVDAAPWGFAPFHYGRWAYIGSRWGWCPGPIAVVGYGGPAIRPYYAPALVAWFGGAHWAVSVAVGPSLGWVPLGFGEVYTPAYACSRRYFSDVNVYNTHIVKNVNITNVYNTVYVNKTVYNQQFVNVHAPNAVQVMPQSAFASGRPVHQTGVALRTADQRQLGNAAVVSPSVAPTRQAFLSPVAHPAARPLPQVVNRPVVAVHTPAVTSGPAPATKMVRPVAPVQAQPGQRLERPAIAQQPVHVQPPARIQQSGQPPHPLPAHGVPPNLRGGYNTAGNRPSVQRPQPQQNQSAPVYNRPSPVPRPQDRPAERVAPQPPTPPQYQRPAVEHPAPSQLPYRPAPSYPENRPPAPPQHTAPAPPPHFETRPPAPPPQHSQPVAPPPPNREEQQHNNNNRPPEHNNEHNNHKS